MVTDAELIFWIVAAIVAWVGIGLFLVIGEKIWGDGR